MRRRVDFNKKSEAEKLSPALHANRSLKSKPLALAGGLFSGLVIPFWRLDHQTHLQGFGRDLDSANLAVHNRPNLLNIGFEFSLGNTGGLLTHTTQVLRFTAAGNASAGGCFLT